MFEMTDFEKKLAYAIAAEYEAVFFIDNTKKMYQTIRATDFWREILDEQGTLTDLYRLFFADNFEKRADSEREYEVFIDETFFQREKCQGMLRFFVSEEESTKNGGEQERQFMYHLVKLSDTEAGFIISSLDEVLLTQKVEQEKIDMLHEDYLFSMIVDLNTDSCINSNTTEVGTTSQSFMNIKYSDWRNKISNMFLSNDKGLFLKVSSPDFIFHKLETKGNFKLELQMLNMVGEYIWSRLTFRRMSSFSRENARFVYTVQDIDKDMKRLLQQQNIIKAVEAQNEKLQYADQEKSAFISNMSHEIRTPINAVLGMNEMIIRETTDEKIRSYAYDIKNASKILLSIINDILDFSKIESGKMEIIPVEYCPAGLIRDTCNLVTGKLQEKKIDFELNISPDIPKKLYGDEIRITQIISNILSNAAKYTKEGKVTFSIDVVSQSETAVELRVCVEDTGVGMRTEEMDKLFSAFTRLDEKKNRNIEGTGLGMSIVTRLLAQMGSRIEVESEYGVGSKFWFVLSQGIVDKTPMEVFTLENAQQEAERRAHEKELSISKARILAVDDNQTNLRVIQSLLKQTKAEVSLAKRGQQALAILQKQKINLIFLDHFMPDMDGVETLAEIRKMGDPYDKIPVIALTANVVSGARDYYIGMGFSDFLEKPINTEKLEEVLWKNLPKECFDE